MRDILLAWFPIVISVLYIAWQLLSYTSIGRIYYSESFATELALYSGFGVLYVLSAYHFGRWRFAKIALIGFAVGFTIFFVGSAKIFLAFEFHKNLSI
jgi:hypothetical protein